VITYSLTDPAWCMSLGLEADVSGFVCLANPMTGDRTHLRRHILRAISILDRAQDGLLRDDRAGNPDDGESDAQAALEDICHASHVLAQLDDQLKLIVPDSDLHAAQPSSSTWLMRQFMRIRRCA
jgi:hypothetical protein